MRPSSRSTVVGWVAFGLVTASSGRLVVAADWPQWRGPQRNGVSSEAVSPWPAPGPKRLWSSRIGEGFSSVAVKGSRLYTLGNAGERDTVYCLSTSTGKPLWRYSYACSSGDYGGPRATPTLDGNRVYTFSREAQAFCLDANSGKLLWRRDLARETGAEPPQWGFAGSPLVAGSRVIYNVGTAGTALDKNSGRVLWKSGSGPAGYASPIAYRAGGQTGVAIFTAPGLVAVDPASGRRQWQFPWETSFGVNAADPIFAADAVFISSNYNTGAALIRLGSGGSPSLVWQNRNMRNHFNSCVLVGGYLYGNDENTLKCIELRTGAERWRRRGLGKGGLIAAGGNLLVLTERGLLSLLRATPDRYTELARAQVLDGTCWTHPVLANGLLYCRSHEGTLVCLDVRGKG